MVVGLLAQATVKAMSTLLDGCERLSSRGRDVSSKERNCSRGQGSSNTSGEE